MVESSSVICHLTQLVSGALGCNYWGSYIFPYSFGICTTFFFCMVTLLFYAKPSIGILKSTCTTIIISGFDLTMSSFHGKALKILKCDHHGSCKWLMVGIFNTFLTKSIHPNKLRVSIRNQGEKKCPCFKHFFTQVLTCSR